MWSENFLQLCIDAQPGSVPVQFLCGGGGDGVDLKFVRGIWEICPRESPLPCALDAR